MPAISPGFEGAIPVNPYLDTRFDVHEHPAHRVTLAAHRVLPHLHARRLGYPPAVRSWVWGGKPNRRPTLLGSGISPGSNTHLIANTNEIIKAGQSTVIYRGIPTPTSAVNITRLCTVKPDNAAIPADGEGRRPCQVKTRPRKAIPDTNPPIIMGRQ